MSEHVAAPPNKDPLIDEVRRIRLRMSARYGNDVRRLCDHLRRVEKRYAGRLVKPQGDEPITR